MGGTVQLNYRLQTTTQPCVLRYYQQGRSFPSVCFEIYLLTYLKRRHYPCPAPLKNSRGRYVGMYAARPYALFEYMEGHPIQNPTEYQKRQVIEKAALLHTITKCYRPRYRQARWNYSVPLCRSLAEQEARSLGTPDAEEKLAWLRRELSRLELPASLPKGICHGDFHYSNILFRNETFSALLDFDDANYTFLLFDLVGLIEAWAWPYPGDLDFAEARKTLSAYTAHRPLNLLEKRHLFDVYKFSILMDCVWYFRRGSGSDFYERRKIDFLDSVGRERFHRALF
jgi:Ser/Thr protein kinase RdoA (MazF antagonist)